MSAKMAASQPWHCGSRGKLPKSEQTHLARRHTWHICTCDQNGHVCRVGPPIGRLLAKLPSCHHGCQAEQLGTTPRLLGKLPTCHHGARTFIKRPRRVEYTTFKIQLKQASDHCWDTWAQHSRVLFHAMLISPGIGHQRLCPAERRTSPDLLPTWL